MNKFYIQEDVLCITDGYSTEEPPDFMDVKFNGDKFAFLRKNGDLFIGGTRVSTNVREFGLCKSFLVAIKETQDVIADNMVIPLQSPRGLSTCRNSFSVASGESDVYVFNGNPEPTIVSFSAPIIDTKLDTKWLYGLSSGGTLYKLELPDGRPEIEATMVTHIVESATGISYNTNEGVVINGVTYNGIPEPVYVAEYNGGYVVTASSGDAYFIDGSTRKSKLVCDIKVSKVFESGLELYGYGTGTPRVIVASDVVDVDDSMVPVSSTTVYSNGYLSYHEFARADKRGFFYRDCLMIQPKNKFRYLQNGFAVGDIIKLDEDWEFVCYFNGLIILRNEDEIVSISEDSDPYTKSIKGIVRNGRELIKLGNIFYSDDPEFCREQGFSLGNIYITDNYIYYKFIGFFKDMPLYFDMTTRLVIASSKPLRLIASTSEEDMFDSDGIDIYYVNKLYTPGDIVSTPSGSGIVVGYKNGVIVDIYGERKTIEESELSLLLRLGDKSQSRFIPGDWVLMNKAILMVDKVVDGNGYDKDGNRIQLNSRLLWRIGCSTVHSSESVLNGSLDYKDIELRPYDVVTFNGKPQRFVFKGLTRDRAVFLKYGSSAEYTIKRAVFDRKGWYDIVERRITI